MCADAKRFGYEFSHDYDGVQLKDIEGFEVGQQLSLTEMFKEGDFIDVAGKSVGKGFQGSVLLLI